MVKAGFKKQRGMVCAIPLFILLYGCASGAGIIKEDIYIKDVPFFPQERYHCGPSSLASVMNYYGVSVSEEDVAKEVYNPRLSGTLSMDMLRYARLKGFDASYYNGNIERVKKEIEKGRPVILFLDFGYSFYPVRHYMTAIGYNDEGEYIIAHSGRERDKRFSYREIKRAWERTGFGTILITPKGK